MSDKKPDSKPKLDRTTNVESDDLKKYIKKNEAQHKVLKKIAQMLEKEKDDTE